MQINFFGDFVAPDVKYLHLTSKLKNILGSGDVNVVNCEAVTIGDSVNEYTPIHKTGPNISQSNDTPKWLIDNYFHVCSLANNHIFDYGEQALRYTMDSFSENFSSGCGSWDVAYRPLIKTIDGKKIAFFCLTQCEFGTLTDTYSCTQFGAAWINHPDVDSIIVKVRKKVDYLFIYAHAGVEYMEQPLPEWRERYHSLIDLGCDAVIASHPHVIQGWEFYNGKPIVYSLGNFYFPINGESKVWFRSICASLIIKDDKISLKITPLCFEKNKIDVDLSNETREHLDKINYILADKEKYMQFIDKESVDQLENYYTMFMRGGMSRSYTLKKILRQFLVLVKKQYSYQPEWLINNLQCESHRWFYLRGIKNTLKCEEVISNT